MLVKFVDGYLVYNIFRVECTKVDQNLISDQRNFREKYLQKLN